MAKEVKRARANKAASGGRTRKLTKKQLRDKAKKEARSLSQLPGSFKLTWQVIATLRQFWKPLAGVVIVYLLLNIIFASGLSNLSGAVTDIKTNLDNNSGLSTLGTALGGFGNLVISGGTGTSPTGSALQSMLIVLESLVIIWALRQLLAGKSIKVKEAYYKSTAPLIPFLLVIFVIIIQLLPLAIGSSVTNTILQSIFVDGGTGPIIIFSIVFILLAIWTSYMLCSSIFALYIVTLADMQPRRALKSAKNLVSFRRLLILRRLFFLPILILLVMGILVVPLIMFATFLVVPVFYILSMLSILFIHTYLYSLYRSLLP